jgi:hypothetical protein
MSNGKKESNQRFDWLSSARNDESLSISKYSINKELNISS